MPKLLAGQYGAEISALMAGKPRRHPLELLGRRPRRLRPPGGAPRRAQEEHRRPHLRRDRDPQARGPDPRRHHHRRARAARRLRPRQRAQPLVPDHLPGPLRPLPELPRLPHVAGDPRPQGRLREGRRAGGAAPEPGPGHRRVRGAHLRDAERHDQDGARQGPPGGRGDRLRHGEDRRREAHLREGEAVPGGEGEPAGGREERRLDQDAAASPPGSEPGPRAREAARR